MNQIPAIHLGISNSGLIACEPPLRIAPEIFDTAVLFSSFTRYRRVSPIGGGLKII